MARKGKIENEKRKQKMNAKYDKLRESLKDIIKNKSVDMKQKLEAHLKLQDLPRMSARNRLKNRDFQDGNPRSYCRLFGRSRWGLLEDFRKRRIAGVVPASW